MALVCDRYSIMDILYIRNGLCDIILGLSLINFISEFYSKSGVEYMFGDNYELKRYFGYFIIAIGIIRLITTYNKYYKWIAFTYFLESFVVLNEAYVFNTIPNDIIILSSVLINISIGYITLKYL